MRSADLYQLALIGLGAIAAVMFGMFLSREMFPEYKIYQEDYVALERFRSSYTGEPVPEFKGGVKQILIEKKDHSSPTIDRCTSCHVALQFPHFSPTKIARDLNGNMILDEQGTPVQIPNDEYVWEKLNQKIRELVDPSIIAALNAQGKSSEAKKRLDDARNLELLKEVRADNRIYDVTKALRMHPLIGKETRPFEFHPLEEYGCVSCHGGNGRAITTAKAHGPLFDGEYEIEFEGPKPEFLESDPENDPKFARLFNSKPGPDLLFQTTPLFVGSLIQAKCTNCHQTSAAALENSFSNTSDITKKQQKRVRAIQDAFENEKSAVLTLLKVSLDLKKDGFKALLDNLENKSREYTLPSQEIEQASSQLATIKKITKGLQGENAEKTLATNIEKQLQTSIGTALTPKLLEAAQETQSKGESLGFMLDQFIETHLKDGSGKGTLFAKAAAWDAEQAISRHVKDTETSLSQTVRDQNFLNSVTTDFDLLTKNYQRGQELFISQACFACHRIAGFSRGGVGPELTNEGESHPWFIKESIVWPQADLPTSTMPNQRLDHAELEDLMTYLLAQTGKNRASSDTGYKIAIQEWEAGKKSSWEKPITPVQMHDLRYSMTVFATEGCAACHRLKGYESNVGFALEKNNTPSFDALYDEREWFKHLFPEMATGPEIVKALEDHQQAIDERIVDDVRQNSILEEIESQFPGQIEALYSPFKFANRAKNSFYATQIAQEVDLKKKESLQDEMKAWKARTKRVLMAFIQEYGLGRLICPRPNWSGVYRSDEWLMEHFRNPSSHAPRSIMPIFPFDDTKFYGLTYMLDQLGIKNRDAVREIWNHKGFSPEIAFQILCSQCHGEFRQGNGPVAEWLYPIPKNLRNIEFLRNLTKEQAINSITHGVKGTPMPTWGEAPMDKPSADGTPVLNQAEIKVLAEWLFSSTPGTRNIPGNEQVPKWQYTPQDVLEELMKEGRTLEPQPVKQSIKKELSFLPTGENFYASLSPALNLSEGDKPLSVSDVFEEIPQKDVGASLYYIKNEFYTPYNISQGKQFFDLNCAICHGQEADGSGLRAEVMKDAKPRMLINLDWIQNRDDLRLLRSIKYGVPGTAMTPWGDLTTSLQRMQLVIFIRSLNQSQELRSRLLNTIYKVFETARIQLETARVEEYKKLEEVQLAYQSIRDKSKASAASVDNAEAIKIYQEELNLASKLKQEQERDQLFTAMSHSLQQELKIYQELGFQILTAELDGEIFEDYLQLIGLNQNRYSLSEQGGLQMREDTLESKEKRILLQTQIEDILNHAIKELEKKKNIEEGKFSSAEKTQELALLNSAIHNKIKLRNSFIADINTAQRLLGHQQSLYQKITTSDKNERK